jgi:hypothetical protein
VLLLLLLCVAAVPLLEPLLSFFTRTKSHISACPFVSAKTTGDSLSLYSTPTRST